ncbi:eCIS core domain-containing protein [Nostoc sp. WHI]|uniref:eCIS core domain-containing protein n=1 Tax=Nostoc sp. WHI TaxID=2650611 RepID=UPI0018C4A508|nr:DUF4157 domain-containing protein [Nostoc sp. WHI]MBG1270885.1 DUF4157 domain-containing protein [Nostoc sp. WHI]
MLNAPVNDKKMKPKTSHSEVEQEPERLKGFSGWGDRQGQNDRLAAMQQAYGNQAALRMINGGVLQRKCACGNTAGSSGSCAECQSKREGILQTKLRVSEPGDRYEQEADRVADEVMRMPEPTIQRQVESEKEGIVQRKAIAQQNTSEMPSIVYEVLNSPGHPLDPETRAFVEPRFGQDFSHVRVYTDAEAAQSAQAVNAKAYTMKRDIVFGAGQYAPRTADGKRLLAHELTHVVQQGAAVDRQGQDRKDASLRVQSTPMVSQGIGQHNGQGSQPSVIHNDVFPSVSGLTPQPSATALIQREPYRTLIRDCNDVGCSELPNFVNCESCCHSVETDDDCLNICLSKCNSKWPNTKQIGLAAGGVLGGIAGAILGGGAGTLALPVGGTFVGGAEGAVLGAGAGAALGGAIGLSIGNIYDWLTK